MIPFVDWIEENPFYIRDSWDFENNKWGGPGRLVLFEHQKRILSHCLTPNEDGLFPYTTVLYSCTKKSGKTQLGAAIAGWYAEQASAGTELYVCANDQESAEGRVFRDLKYHYKRCIAENPDDDAPRITMYKITLPNETFMQALAQSYRSAAGSRHAFTEFDELWGVITEDSRRMWDEMTPIPTVALSLRVITTYAGFTNESDLLWDLYLQGVGEDENIDGKGEKIEGLEDLPCWANASQFTYWDHEPRMPWQTSIYYDEQLNTLRPAAYLRLHENRWVTTHETFIPIEWWEHACTFFNTPADQWLEHPYRHSPVFVGVDAATKRDCTAAVGVTYDPVRGKVIILFHKIWTPRDDEVFDLEDTIEFYLLDKYNKYRLNLVTFDPTQLHQSMVRLRSKGVPMEEFPQTAQNMTLASQALYDVMKYQNLEAYPDEEAKSHVQNAVAQEEGRGFRIVRDRRSRLIQKPIDFTIALAMAVYKAVETMGRTIDTPIRIESPFADRSAWKATDPEEDKLPFPFRS